MGVDLKGTSRLTFLYCSLWLHKVLVQTFCLFCNRSPGRGSLEISKGVEHK